MDHLFQDIRYGCRRLIRSPGFTAVAVLTLALGIGANSAIFSVVNGILLKPLPYAQPDRLVALYHLSEGRRAVMSGPNFTDLRRSSQSLEDAAAVTRYGAVLTGSGDPTRIDAAEVSANLFDLLGVEPVAGRRFRAEENDPAHNKVGILGYGFWQQRFGGSRDVIGQKITIDGVPIEVVGVMPPGFSFPAGRQLYTPLEYTDDFLVKQRGAWYLTVVGRAKEGVPFAQVKAEVETIGRRLAAEYPDQNDGLAFAAVPLLDAMVGDVRSAVLMLLGAVGFVLLIACSNVANLLLARAAARESELAVRAALGAGRGRLVRQLLTESTILSLLGGALGLLLAVWGVDVLIGMQPQGIPRLDDVRVDGFVIAFTFAASFATGLVFGLVPAFHATRAALAGTLKEAGRGALTSRSGNRLRGGLVIVETALAVMLLAGAGLMIKSFTRLTSVDPGFAVAPALTFQLSLPESRYGEEAQMISFFDQLMPRLRSLPGVQEAGATVGLPMSGLSFVLTFEVAGRPPLPPSQQPAMQIRVATPEYFKALGIPLVRGRLFDERDREGAPAAALLTEAAAKQFFPGEDPIGKRITLGWGRGEGKPRAGGEVIGIIGDVKDAGLGEPDPPQLYLSFHQWPVQSMTVLLKTAVPPESLTDAVRREVYAIDPNVPVASVRTLEQIVERSVSQPRFYMALLAAFAAVALVLAAIGIFGVLSFGVAQRTREIGIRMALGARESSVVSLVIGQAMALTGLGIALGVVASWFLSTSISALLFDTSPRDLATFALVASALAIVALVASAVPARRAARVDPIVALRAE
jgi:putative ABC transport system permease protein